jgi:hypothetical protein
VRPSLLRHLRRKPLPNRLLQKHRPSLLLPSQSLKLPQPNLLPNRLRENRLLPALQNLRLKPRLPNQPPHDLPLQEPLLPNQPWLKPPPRNRLQNQLQNRPLNQLPAPLPRNLLPSRLQNPSLQNRQPNLQLKQQPSQRQNLL